MPLTQPVRRRARAVAVAAALATGLAAPVALLAPAASGASAAPLQRGGVRLLAGGTPTTRPFPDDRSTVADAAQLTGRRVALPTQGCAAAGKASCDALGVIDSLDGFDLQPTVSLPFSGTVDVTSITPATVSVLDPRGRDAGGLVSLVSDPVSHIVSGQTDRLLQGGTTYTLVIRPGIQALDGTAVDVCAAGGCARGASERRVRFTTQSASAVLDAARSALDSGAAYDAAGIAPGARGVNTSIAADGSHSIYTNIAFVARRDQTTTDATKLTTPDQSTGAGFAAGPTTTQQWRGFGAISSPQLLGPDAVIPSVPTRSAPAVRGAATVGVAVMSALPPAAATPATCLRPVIFGPGFTRSMFDVFASSAVLPTATGRAAVFSIDPAGHGFGPAGQWLVNHSGVTSAGPAYGRGSDLDGDRQIGSTEGSQPTAASPSAIIGARDGLIQTVVDQMALVRALERGVDIDGNGTIDTCTPSPSDPAPVTYYGQSFGGIYGTMLLGTDPRVQVGVPNVPGGPVTEIARESPVFRPLLQATLAAAGLADGGPGLAGFTESVPLRRDPSMTTPAPGSAAVRQLLTLSQWAGRPGSPETAALALATGARFGGKKVIFQSAYGDGTVPNPTANRIYRAVGDYSRVWVFRNDRTATALADPHGFLLGTAGAVAAQQGQEQIATYLTSRGAAAVDPDGRSGLVWERGDAKGADYPGQLDCLHYADPQSGRTGGRDDFGPPCPDQSNTTSGQVSVRLPKTFVRFGERVRLSGTVTARSGPGQRPSPAAGAVVTVTETYSDGKIVPLGRARTGAAGTWSLSVRPLYNGTIAAVAAGTRGTAASRVIVTFRSATASVSGSTVAVTAQTRPGFITGPGRQERAQLLLVDADGTQRQVLAVADAAQRTQPGGEAQGTNAVGFRVTLPSGTSRLVVKVIGTPVNTGASSPILTVTVP